MVKKVFLYKKKLFNGKLNLELKKRITNDVSHSECGTVCSQYMDNDASRWMKIKSI